jgi:hypothetical protein
MIRRLATENHRVFLLKALSKPSLGGRKKLRYWWVNQNQTFRQELDGGYLWSPKRNKNGHCNPFYEFMREVAPGDIVFSFVDTRIAALGIVSGYCRESPKPEEFGSAGANWSQIGWRVGVRWQRLANGIRPKDHIDPLRPDLANKYAPLTPDGNGQRGHALGKLRHDLRIPSLEATDEFSGTQREWRLSTRRVDVASAELKPRQ